MSMHPSMRLEYGPKSGAILGELFLTTSLTCFPSRELLLTKFNPKPPRVIHEDYDEPGGGWHLRNLTGFSFREPEFVPCLLIGYHDRTIVPVWQYIKMEAFQGRD